MRRFTVVASMLLGAVMVPGVRASAQDLKAGDPAPDFTLRASDGRTYSLSQLRGRAVVLAWFPKAFTAG
jgi:peroxiredoxin Q/BCP